MKLLSLHILSIVCLAVIMHSYAGSDTLLPFPFIVIDTIGIHNLQEPSGIDFHSKRKTLFVVGDEGDIYELSLNGKIIQQNHIEDTDLEGITHDPETGFLYCAVEGPEEIIELDPQTLKSLRVFSIPRKYKGSTVMKKGGQGIEAITFVPDIGHPHGGTFFIANQSFELGKTDELSALFELTLPLKAKDETTITIMQCHLPDIVDLSGIFFNRESGYLMVISDKTNTLFEIHPSGNIGQRYSLPGKDQEGFTFDNNGLVYVAQDSGGILKLQRLRK